MQPAARVLPLLGSVLLVLTLETVLTRGRGRLILRSGGVTAVTAPPACLEVEDVVNSEFQRGGGSTWRVHFVHILQTRKTPRLFFFFIYLRDSTRCQL